MANIKPVSYLRNNFADVSAFVHENSEPIYLTKNGYGDMVVMSIETYEKSLYDAEVYIKLKEAELELRSGSVPRSSEDVFGPLYRKYGVEQEDV